MSCRFKVAAPQWAPMPSASRRFSMVPRICDMRQVCSRLAPHARTPAHALLPPTLDICIVPTVAYLGGGWRLTSYFWERALVGSQDPNAVCGTARIHTSPHDEHRIITKVTYSTCSMQPAHIVHFASLCGSIGYQSNHGFDRTETTLDGQ